MTSALHTLYRAQPAAKRLFEWILRDGVDDDRTTTVQLLTDELGIAKRTAVSLLRSLGELGIGEFKVGRKGHPTRFEWAEDPRTLLASLRDTEAHVDGRAAEGHERLGGREDGLFPDIVDRDEPLPGLAGDDAAGDPAGDAAGDAAGVALIEHVYVLRPGLRVVVPLPADLSAREAEVLGDWLRNLSFER